MKTHYKYIIIFIKIFFCFPYNTMGQDGKTLFKQNCAACHKLGKKLIGPDLIGIGERRKADWLLQFIKSSQKLIKAGDPEAVAIFEEYDKAIMNDQVNLSDNQIETILSYIEEETQKRKGLADTTLQPVEEEVVPIEYTEQDIQIGRQLFSGKKKFSNKGVSCVSCHHIDNDQLVSGGILAKDLTTVYERMGDAGLAGILSVPPFPAMTVAYKNNALDSVEIAQVTAFLKHANHVKDEQTGRNSGRAIMILGGGSGLLILFLLIGIIWNRRLKNSVKHDIYKR